MAFFEALLARFRNRGGEAVHRRARDLRPADGRVELSVIRGVVAEPNPHDARFRCFLKRSAELEGQPPRSRSRARPPLLGRVVLVSIFVGRDGAGWSDEEIARAHREMERAAGWMEREADRNKAAVNVELADTYFRGQDDVVEDVEIQVVEETGERGLFEADAVTKAVASASRASATMGFSDVIELIEDTDARLDADLHIWLLHLRRAGRSLAVTADLAPIPGVTMAICFARYESFPAPLSRAPYLEPATLAHEILHLCGATDKYGMPLGRFARGSVTERDIMRLDTSLLSRLRVDPLTAAEIGWAVAK
jgi:hypothetical protein